MFSWFTSLNLPLLLYAGEGRGKEEEEAEGREVRPLFRSDSQTRPTSTFLLTILLLIWEGVRGGSHRATHQDALAYSPLAQALMMW